MHRTVNTLNQLIACPDCDLLMSRPETSTGTTAICPRCKGTLYKKTANSIDKTLALSIAGLLLYLPSILLPLMTFESFGISDSANILESIINFYQNRYYFVAAMVLLTAVVLPLVLLTAIFLVSLHLRLRRFPQYLARLFRHYLHLEEWAMVEVYLLGITITIIKMADSADVTYHMGVVCFTVLVLVTLAISTVIDKELFWQTIATSGQALPEKPDKTPDIEERATAASQGLILCTTCDLLSPDTLSDSACPRCGETLHSRKVSSISRTWALVLTSAIFLAPANLLPIMRVDFLGIPDNSTIMDGIIYFFQDGAYLIGLIIFAASILVPVFKIVGLIILLTTTRPCGDFLLRQKTKMFRFIQFIGRWSMLDVFVIALLTVLVDFGFLTSIHTAPAATYFCIVVTSTMFAALTFDPRLMWDRCSPCNNRGEPPPPFSQPRL